MDQFINLKRFNKYKMKTIYLDGIFDLYHRGHIESFKQCLEMGDKLIIGVISDKDAEGYKRRPIICENKCFGKFFQ